VKELVILSGKGGTGKTSVVAALAALSPEKVLADCDVDAPDLHLVLRPRLVRREPFLGGQRAVREAARCSGCGRCREVCRFGAVSEDFGLDPARCEGCGVCAWFCPEEAIRLQPRLSGELLVSETRHGPLAHARLHPGEEASGKLVTRVRQEARRLAEEDSHSLIIADGPPGVGCPVIASLTGAGLLLAVTEPSLSARHDLGRLLDLASHFEVPAGVCLNKWDLDPKGSSELAAWLAQRGVPLLARVPYEPGFTRAQIEGCSLVELPDGGGAAGEALRQLWEGLQGLLSTPHLTLPRTAGGAAGGS
jgi:MinD superfamily P-loop ATPase